MTALMPREHPILFSGPMIRALLAGKKTQTRRAAKSGKVVGGALPYFDNMTKRLMNGDDTEVTCPYGAPGDRLWVRETWCESDGHVTPKGSICYRANINDEDTTGFKWKPSIFMKRAASRITLDVTEVRVERVQDISEEDARAEGATYHDGHGVGHSGWRHDPDHGYVYATARASFAVLWQSINGARPGCAWVNNPRLWVVSFSVVSP